MVVPRCGELYALMGSNQVCIPLAAGFDDALLRLIIDVDNAKALAVSFGPLKIIDERPDEVTAQWCATLDTLGHCLDMVAQVGDTLWVIDALIAVQVVAESRPVFGDVDSRHLIILVDAHDDIAQPLRVNLPAHIGIA